MIENTREIYNIDNSISLKIINLPSLSRLMNDYKLRYNIEKLYRASESPVSEITRIKVLYEVAR